MFRKILAIIKKDFLVETSYKLSFFFSIFSVISTILIYFFIDRMFGHKMTKYLEEFGVNYFSYVLVSMAFFSYIGVGIGSFSNRLRSEQLQGTLESIMLTPTKIYTILFGMGLWNLIFATLDVSIYIILGVFLFKINFSHINIISASLILILTIFSFSSLGIISAAFIMIFKRGNPFGWMINNLEGLLGGISFPIAVMPGWLQLLAKFLPITYAVKAMELSIYKGYSLVQLKSEITFLFIFSIILLPLSISIFKYSLKKSCQYGTLSQY